MVNPLQTLSKSLFNDILELVVILSLYKACGKQFYRLDIYRIFSRISQYCDKELTNNTFWQLTLMSY